MKSEQEFLNEMWTTIAKIEHEEQQKRQARQKHRSLLIQNGIIYTALCVNFLLLLFIDVTNLDLLYGVGIVYLVLGYMWDSFLHKKLSN
ncbi:hypothetical protein ACE6ED_09155 [Paenibacillus sp. CN-4]|uniref:hypothetical protein n=1 Tax=Paenibacillus nanchangensis TaxID=3348343 RepID=UPI00397B9C6C